MEVEAILTQSIRQLIEKLDKFVTMQLTDGGKMMCQRLPREIRDRIYEYCTYRPETKCCTLAGPVAQDVAAGKRHGTHTGLRSSTAHIPSWSVSENYTSAEFNDILAHDLLFRLDKADPQMATELVQWFYEHMDLGLTCFHPQGVHVMTPELPPILREKPCPPWNFPTLDICDLQEVLDTDLFGVGLTPSDCKLPALSVLVTEKTTYGNTRQWPRTVPFKQTMTCAAMDTLLFRVLTQSKTVNFKLQVFALAWCMDPSHSPSLLELLAKVHDISADSELLRNHIEVKSTYFEYLLHRADFHMVKAYRSEGLRRPTDWDAAQVKEPLFSTWYDWHREQKP
ncbi:hypothetical protein P171DRAFT_491144 [Karstenula rhodostoma CBS 690.94]|uniref:Uncharacterized protein n=1 Tax=Karstenula rhodostoma CBS 690.94 TaxID=1392251 RepID=A0A9P4P746_9PLEO|nr:hypothetical protein P171DRAFT_491144 [Karstenula rhodostoma CBS 690.94]